MKDWNIEVIGWTIAALCLFILLTFGAYSLTSYSKLQIEKNHDAFVYCVNKTNKPIHCAKALDIRRGL